MTLFRLISIQCEITCMSFLTRALLLYAVYVFHLITVSLLFCVVISNALTLFHIFKGTGKKVYFVIHFCKYVFINRVAQYCCQQILHVQSCGQMCG